MCDYSSTTSRRAYAKTSTESKGGDILREIQKDKDLRDAFGKFDVDGNGTIEIDELRDTMKELGHELTEDEATRLFARMDLDGNGEIDFEV
jgi:Ca2+-binding EF-hand superfamily protein